MEISIGQLFRIFMKHWYVVVIFAVLLAILAGGFVAITAETSYRATTRIYLSNPSSATAQNNFASIEGLRSFSQTYIDLMQSRTVYDQVREETNTTYSDRQFKNMIKISNSEESLVFTITLTASNKEESVRLLNCFADIAITTVTKTIGEQFCKGEIIDPAILNSVTPVKQSAIKVGLIAAIIGAVLSYIVVFIIDITDTTIHEKEDLEDVSEHPVIGVIPNLNESYEDKKQKGAIY